VVKVSCDTNIGATINKVAQFTIDHAYLYVEGAITTKTTDAWRGNQIGNSGKIRYHYVGVRWVVTVCNEGNTTGWGTCEVVNKKAQRERGGA
jgi:hypothetical protein